MITKIKSKLHTDTNLKELVSGSIITFVLKMGGMLLGYLVIIIISKQYGAEGIGMYSLTLSIITFLAMLSAVGMDMSVLRYVGQFNKENNNEKLKILYHYMLEISIVLSLIVAFFLFLSAQYIALHVFHDASYEDALKVASFIIPFFTITNLNIEYIRGLKKLKISEYFRSVNRPVFNVLFLLIASLYMTDYIVPLYTLATAIVITFAFSSYYIFQRIRKIHVKCKQNFHKKELLETSFPMLLTALASFLMGNIALVFLQMFSTTDQVGIFSVALKIAMLISLVLMVVNTISAPKFSELYWSKEYDALQKIIHQSTKMILFLSLFIAILVTLLDEYILRLFGNEFVAGSTALLFLVVGQVVNAATGSVGVFLNMTGNQKILRNIVVFTMFISIILNYILIPIYGINGAALTTMIAAIIANGAAVYYVKTKLGYTTYFIPSFLRKL